LDDCAKIGVELKDCGVIGYGAEESESIDCFIESLEQCQPARVFTEAESNYLTIRGRSNDECVLSLQYGSKEEARLPYQEDLAGLGVDCIFNFKSLDFSKLDRSQYSEYIAGLQLAILWQYGEVLEEIQMVCDGNLYDTQFYMATCDEFDGKECNEFEKCVGTLKEASDTEKCCIGECVLLGCYDTDAGRNIFSKGFTQIEGKEDLEEKCLNENQLQEYYCALEPRKEGKRETIEIVECEYGCSNGACLISPTDPCANVHCPENKKCVNGECALKICSEMSGKKCLEGETCDGIIEQASDTASCCIGNCVSQDECAENSECDDGLFYTLDTCAGTPKKCTNSFIEDTDCGTLDLASTDYYTAGIIANCFCHAYFECKKASFKTVSEPSQEGELRWEWIRKIEGQTSDGCKLSLQYTDGPLSGGSSTCTDSTLATDLLIGVECVDKIANKIQLPSYLGNTSKCSGSYTNYVNTTCQANCQAAGYSNASCAPQETGVCSETAKMAVVHLLECSVAGEDYPLPCCCFEE